MRTVPRPPRGGGDETYQTVALLGTGAAAGAEEVAAVAGLRVEAATLVALGAAVDLGELLAVVLTVAPAALLALLVAGRAGPLRGGEVVHADQLLVLPRDDLLPEDCLDVAQVVVVEDAHAAAEDVCGQRRDRSGQVWKASGTQ